jgi:hypothetical protein
MSDCGKMFKGASGCFPSGTNPPRGGTRPRIAGFNYDDVIDITHDADGRVLTIIMAPGTTGYLFEGFRNDIKKSDEVINPGVGLNQFRHLVGLVIYSRTQEDKNNIEKLCKGRSIWITESKGKDDDAVELHGEDVGVEIVPGAIRNLHENGGFFLLNFATPEGEFESKLPVSVGTDYDDAQEIIDALAPAESS